MPGGNDGSTREVADTENSVSGEVHGPVVQVGSVVGDLTIGTSSALPVPRELPLDVLGFAGRDAELAEIDRLGASAVVISAIDGMAGVGKTALAVHAAHRLADRFPDGQLFVDLRGYSPDMVPVEPAAVLDQMLRSLGVPGERVPATVEERSALLRTRLAGRRVLVVLDNAATETQIRPLLPGTPGCLVLATSRARLTGLDDAVPLSLDVLAVGDAVALFIRAVGEHRVTDAGVAEEIVRLCGRLPLAIRVAAARLRHRPAWSLRYLADLLRDERSRLGELEAGQLSVEAALGVSYAQLTAEQQRVFRLLSLHPGVDFDPYATAALTHTSVSAARRVLEQLLDVHLLIQRTPGRYAFHDLVRAYAIERTHTSDTVPDRDAALTRLLDHYAHIATMAIDMVYPYNADQRPHLQVPVTPAPDLDDRGAAEAWLDVELRNLLATAQTTGRSSPSYTTHLSVTLLRHLRLRGRYNDAETLHHHALTIARKTGDRTGELKALIGLGEARTMQGRFGQAIDFLSQALEIARETGDRTSELNALNSLGRVLLPHGRYEQATDLLRQALKIALDIGDRYGATYALTGLGNTHVMRGHYGQAIHYFGQALANARETGDRYCEIYALHGIGHTSMQQGRYKQAIRCFEQMLENARSVGDRYGQIYALNGFGHTRWKQGRHEQAADSFEQALDMAQDIGHRYGQIHALDGLSRAHLLEGRHKQAVDSFRRVLKMARDVGDRIGETYALNGLGRAHLIQGRYEQAVDSFGQALEIAHNVGSRDNQLQVHYGLAQAHAATGNPDQALTHHRIALDLATELSQPQDQARAHDGLAHANQTLGRPELARHHWQTALDILTMQEGDHTEDPQVNTVALRTHLTNLDKTDTEG